MSIIDISVPLQNGIVVWPGDVPLSLERRRFLERDGANVSVLNLSLHTGTHVDPPLHFVAGGATVDQLPLDALIGPADVIDLSGLDLITAADLERQELPADCQRLLLRTRNSEYWARGDTVFHEDYVALSSDAAQWVVDRGLRLVGIDYLSIEPFRLPGHPIHQTLLRAGVVALETINLADVRPGRYQLVCLPLRIAGGDGSPARAVLISG